MNMDNRPEFRVQYKDMAGVWCNTGGAYTQYSDAVEKLVLEATSDPEYNHRIVRTEVLGYITAGVNSNE